MDVYLALGTNLGHKEQNLVQAAELITQRIGGLIAASSFYYSQPWGFCSENNFVNQVLRVETDLSAYSIFEQTCRIEQDLGRKRKTVNCYQDRIIDIDILLYGQEIIRTPDLTIPHPLMLERDFVKVPLFEIASFDESFVRELLQS